MSRAWLFGARDQERARMRHDRRRVGARHEQDVDGRLDDHALRDVDEGAVLHERGVQRGEAARC